MVFVAAHNILSPLGNSSAENFAALLAGKSAVREHTGLLGEGSVVWASLFQNRPEAKGNFTRFEQLLVDSVTDAQANSRVDLASDRTLFIISTTKGNIELLEQTEAGQSIKSAAELSLHASARKVAQHFGNKVKPVVISSACISGVMALLYAKRMLQSGQFDAAVVAGADCAGPFVLSGFRAFQALSAGRCKPFSQDRDGINLGEAAATIILTNSATAGKTQLAGGAVTNDANHISGPSRTGKELGLAIEKALQMAQLPAKQIGFISAHGTATVYNDEMEAKAFRLFGVNEKPLFSIKGALGHTLGAAGVVESVLSVLALEQGKLLPTAGFSQPMAEHNLQVSATAGEAEATAALKTASGFGGCNGALVFIRNN